MGPDQPQTGDDLRGRRRGGGQSRLAVLKYRDFRLLWSGELLSMIGTQLQIVAANWQLLQILHFDRFRMALAYPLFGITGAADAVFYVIRTARRQSLTPDAIRGRVAGIHLTLGESSTALGELESGMVASMLGPQFAILSGGLATALMTVYAGFRWHELRCFVPALSHRADQPVEAVASAGKD